MLQEGVQNVPVPSTPVALEAYLQAKAHMESHIAAQAAQEIPEAEGSVAPGTKAASSSADVELGGAAGGASDLSFSAKWSCGLKQANVSLSESCIEKIHYSYNAFHSNSTVCACTKADNSAMSVFIISNNKPDSLGRHIRKGGCEKIASVSDGDSLSIPALYDHQKTLECAGALSTDLQVQVHIKEY